ncbi:MAG: hypothetical protein CM15mV3_0740 [Caudoviricetes sp.]|nr:MAG: hypothetical protein CM15mV3_0740 [Caudoviricetes sp.]
MKLDTQVSRTIPDRNAAAERYGFGDNAEFISKFGLRITTKLSSVFLRRWDEEVAEHNPNLTVTSRPNEGDLLYFPLTQDIYEIKFVGKEEPFFPFGKDPVLCYHC